eukprot:2934015-Lingulodinium_polyedra.AAC.1
MASAGVRGATARDDGLGMRVALEAPDHLVQILAVVEPERPLDGLGPCHGRVPARGALPPAEP